jgi:hypothetical protein
MYTVIHILFHNKHKHTQQQECRNRCIRHHVYLEILVKRISHRFLQAGHCRWIVLQKERVGSHRAQGIKVLAQQKDIHHLRSRERESVRSIQSDARQIYRNNYNPRQAKLTSLGL